MGEIADMMIDGEMCQECGEYLGDGDGYPRTCHGCGGDGANPTVLISDKHTSCGLCHKKFKNKTALVDHIRNKHAKNVNKLISDYLDLSQKPSTRELE